MGRIEGRSVVECNFGVEEKESAAQPARSMSQTSSADKTPSPVDPAAVPAVDPGVEHNLHNFWTKNRGFIFIVCVIVLVGIITREGWQYFSTAREKSIQQDYAQVADKPDRLAAFAEANPGHPLAGIAYLQIADRKFEAGDFKEASNLYTKAASSLKNEALLGRAKVGAAVSLINSGDMAGGEAALKTISSDSSLSKSTRAEASYHVASLASDAGRADDVRKYVDEVTKNDLGGSWAQRATLLLANLPPSANASGIAPVAAPKPATK